MSNNIPDSSVALLGHNLIEARVAAMIHDERLPSALLFSGPLGVGKATMAQKTAAAILAKDNSASDGGLFGDALLSSAPSTLSYDLNHPALSRMAAGSHTDYLLLRPAFDEKKKRFKTVISVDQVRRIGQFLSLTAGESGWKIVIIDAVDMLNINAANALLKWLEEPPARSMFILVSHQPSTLLPTILSRCQQYIFSALDKPSFLQFTDNHGVERASAQQLYRLCAGSPGLALQWIDQSWHTYWQTWLEFAAMPAPQQPAQMGALAQQWRNDVTAYQFAKHCAASLVQRVCGVIATGQLSRYVDTELEAAAINHLMTLRPASYWHNAWEGMQTFMRDGEALSIDQKAIMLRLLSIFAVKA